MIFRDRHQEEIKKAVTVQFETDKKVEWRVASHTNPIWAESSSKLGGVDGVITEISFIEASIKNLFKMRKRRFS